MNRDPMAIRRSDNIKDADMLRAKRKVERPELPCTDAQHTHTAISVRIQRSDIYEAAMETMRLAIEARYEAQYRPFAVQACDDLFSRLKVDAV